MDPTIKLISIWDSLTQTRPATEIPPKFVFSAKTPFGGVVSGDVDVSTLEPETNIPDFIPQIETGLITDIQPSTFLVDINQYETLNEIKNAYIHPSFNEARSATNPFEKIGKSIFMDRASVKLANIDAVIGLTGFDGGFSALQTLKDFTFCDLAGAPGGFSQYIMWKIPMAYGYAISLKPENVRTSTGEVRSNGAFAWNTKDLNMQQLNILDGKDGTGDLIANADWFSDQVSQNEGDGVNLVVADAGIDVTGKEAEQENLTFRLILNEFLVAAQVTKKSGTFVVKVFDTVTMLTAQLLFLMAIVFEEFWIFKPISSRPANSERYVICKKLRPFYAGKVIELLRSANTAYNDGKVVTSLISTPIPENFINYLKATNQLSVSQQLEAGSRILQYLQNPSPETALHITPKYDVYHALLYWNIPDNLTKKEAEQRPINPELFITQSDINMGNKRLTLKQIRDNKSLILSYNQPAL